MHDQLFDGRETGDDLVFQRLIVSREKATKGGQ
jgi:hypothetical protein